METTGKPARKAPQNDLLMLEMFIATFPENGARRKLADVTLKEVRAKATAAGDKRT